LFRINTKKSRFFIKKKIVIFSALILKMLSFSMINLWYPDYPDSVQDCVSRKYEYSACETKCI